MLQVFFLPLSNTILSCFSDDSIFAWECDTLFCKYQLPVPDSGPRISYKAFAVTRWVFQRTTNIVSPLCIFFLDIPLSIMVLEKLFTWYCTTVLCLQRW